MKKDSDKNLKKLLTVIYYTNNREKTKFEEKIKARLLKSIGNLPLISVSQKPIDFGKNICVGDVGASNQNMYRQFQIGAMKAKTPFVVAAQANCLYPKEYFKHVPEDIMACRMYDNVWILDKTSKKGFVKAEYAEVAYVWGREVLIRHIEKRLKGRGLWAEKLEKKDQIPTLFRRESWGYFHSKNPVVFFKTPQGNKSQVDITKKIKYSQEEKLPLWGTAKKLRKEFFLT